MTLTILNVAYPFARVGPNAVGGAEQIVSHIDRGLVLAGHNSLVVAAEGSEVKGRLLAVPHVDGLLDRRALEAGRQRHRAAIAVALRRWSIDIVHLHGVDFDQYIPSPGTRSLVTLHLPSSWYPADVLARPHRDLWLHCVSKTQHESCPSHRGMLSPIANGVPVEELSARHARRRFALTLGRICPEKGTHLALDAARRAGFALLLAGAVFPYPAHECYFQEEVQPRLDHARRFIGAVDFARKRRLLSAARCLIVPSLVEETSSLVAMEALACGTPVIGFRRGALPEIIEDGKTGFLVCKPEELVDALKAVHRIDSATCRVAARRRFSHTIMVAQYIERYRLLAAMSCSAVDTETIS
jgi:glycosyltransferase involved in cell wall biosynthesis